MSNTKLDLSTIQSRLAEQQGRDYWRSLEELAATPEFTDFLHREFPRQASEWQPTLSRRGFLQLVGASIAFAGLTACTPQQEEIVPYVTAPETMVPGKPLFYATAVTQQGYALGLLAQSTDGRPTKVEGNPEHPAGFGATDLTAQASILDLYDPDRSQVVRNGEAESTWDAFLAALREALGTQQASGGSGLRILTEAITSPTVAGQMAALVDAFPNATWHHYIPQNNDNIYAGTNLAFGQPLEPIYHLDAAGVIVSLGADLLNSGPGHVRHARDFADRRRATGEDPAHTGADNRLYVVESTPSLTGAAADHRLPLHPSAIESFARSLAAALGLAVAATNDSDVPTTWLDAVVADLQTNGRSALVVAGAEQPAAVHALAHAINVQLGSVGTTVTYHEPLIATQPESTQLQHESLTQLVDEMAAGAVELLLILGGNPVYNTPAALDFVGALSGVPMSVHLGLYVDETAIATTWHLPGVHYLEEWSDSRAYDGTVTIQQPLIEPLYGGFSIHEVLAALTTGLDDSGINALPSSHDLVRNHWLAVLGEADFEARWRRALHDGVLAESAAPEPAVELVTDWADQLPESSVGDGLTLLLRPDPSVGDGRFANNGWLQEIPKPFTKLTWENALLISPLTAAAQGLTTGDLVEIDAAGKRVHVPVLLLPGHCENAVTLHLGYGRTQAGRVGNDIGVNGYLLQPSDSPWSVADVTLRKVGSDYRLAVTQGHHAMEGRDLIRVGTFAEFAEDPHFVHEMGAHVPDISLYPEMPYEGNSWGMAIDLTACIGCNACVVACQAENNIPVVGKEQVLAGREMHWIRIDTYFEGNLENPAAHHQPVMCMHCENAPCEVVCPVAATMHDSEGLNTMIYNRCVGTRYCANNCPYKVRRFNFLEFTDYESESLALQRNPNVTVRARGVMEKCTYCTQRISAARINAKLEGRAIQDGEVMTACQSACPTRAISFGNLNDGESEVVQHKNSLLNYGLLTELNTKPRTTYLARLRNPNPALVEG